MKKKSRKIEFHTTVITKHAISQYKARVDDRISDEEAKKIIESTANNGEITKIKPCLKSTNMFTYDLNLQYKGIGLVGVLENGILTIVTCTGTRKYRGWYRTNEIKACYRAAV